MLTSARGGAAGGTPGKSVSDIRNHHGPTLASVVRAPKNFEVRWVTRDGEKQIASFDTELHHVEMGGVTLGFCGCSVGLVVVDLTGRRGQMGDGGRVSPVRAFYLLAEGETWSVSKDGTVSITR